MKNWHAVEKLARLWHVGTFIGTLARKNEKLARCTKAREHVDHAGTYDTHGARFSKLSAFVLVICGSNLSLLSLITPNIFSSQLFLDFIPLNKKSSS